MRGVRRRRGSNRVEGPRKSYKKVRRAKGVEGGRRLITQVVLQFAPF